MFCLNSVMISINEMKVSAYYMLSNTDTVEGSKILSTSEQDEEGFLFFVGCSDSLPSWPKANLEGYYKIHL